MKITRSNGTIVELLAFEEYVSEVRALAVEYREANRERVLREKEGGPEYEMYDERETKALSRLSALGWLPGAFKDDRHEIAFEVKRDD